MIVQKDIAEKLGISRSAVSAILQGGARAEKFRPEMRKRVLEAAAHYGYQRNELAHAIRSGRNYTLGFVTQNVSHPHVGVLLNGVLNVANQNNYSVRIINTDQNTSSSEIGRQILGQCLAGVIVYDISHPDFLTNLHELLRRNEIPMVYAGGTSPLNLGLRIESDVEQGGHLAFEHLYQLGHRKLLLASSYQWANFSQQLSQGFLDAAQQTAENIHCLHLSSDHELDYKQACQAILENKLTACFCTTAHLAMRIQSALQQQGIHVPEQVSVMGRGNMEYCNFVIPQLTVLDERLETIGQKAAETLLAALQNHALDNQLVKIQHCLVKRESTINLHP